LEVIWAGRYRFTLWRAKRQVFGELCAHVNQHDTKKEEVPVASHSGESGHFWATLLGGCGIDMEGFQSARALEVGIIMPMFLGLSKPTEDLTQG
jgi:hypothetical protein